VSGRERSPHEAAIAYASHGWPVLPLIPGEKAPASAHGSKDATTDLAQIDAWWERNPDRNVGLATGAPGPDVLDVDNHGEAGNGFASVNRLKRSGLVPPAAATVRTPSGGYHLYYLGTEQGNGTLPKHHIDYRGKGGFVVAPASHVGGRTYEVISTRKSSASLDWQAARNFLDPPQARPQRRAEEYDPDKDLERLTAFVARQEHGNRNAGLHWAASRLAEKSLLDGPGIEALVDAAVKSGLRGGEREARRTIESAMRGSLDFQREAG
jgi:Bifunctional DNA primase/polymerase, N-terminal